MLSVNGNFDRRNGRRQHKNSGTYCFGKRELKNNGSTLITVLVAITFLTVLVSIILAVSTANLRMKQVEYRTKQNFYFNEQILSDVYNGIGKEATQCFSKAYASVLAQTAKNGGEAVYKTEGEAYEAFSRNFMNRLLESFPEGVQDSATLEALNKYPLYAGTATKVKKYKDIEVVRETGSGIPVSLVINGLTADYQEVDGGGNPTGFESTITVDIVIDVPYVTFFEDSSRVLDYAMIGNKGIYFNEGARTVRGSLYAGTADSETAGNMALYRNEDVYGGMNFYGANVDITAGYVISKGDINVRKSSLTIGMDGDSNASSQIWAETFRTAEDMSRNTAVEVSTVALNGQIFLANDLELDARESHVKLDGEFYGYNNGVYATREKKNLTGSYETAAHTQSSSISINGNRSYLDLTGLSTFVVAGNAYIDLANGNFPEGGITGIEEYATGESLALKANQYMYLAPGEFLTGMNPCPAEDGEAQWMEGSSWFAYDKGYLDTSQPIVKKVYGRNGKKYNFFYLNFISKGKKKEFAELVLNMTEPEQMYAEMSDSVLRLYDGFNDIELEQIWELKEEILNKVMADKVRSTIEAADGTTARIYTKGAVVQVKDGKETAQLVEDDRKLSVDYITKIENNLLKHYQHLCTALDPKEEFSLLSDSLPALTDAEMEEADAPLNRFVRLSDLPAVPVVNDSYRCKGKYGSQCKTIICGTDYTVTDDMSGIIICGGDVTVNSGVDVEGIILAGGRIYVKGDGNIEAGRSVVQAMIEEEYAHEIGKESGESVDPSFASRYLIDYNPEHRGEKHQERITGTDYSDYISYRNWKKGDEN